MTDQVEHGWGVRTLVVGEQFRYLGTCTCGWQSRRCVSRDEAARLAFDHGRTK